MVRGPMSKGISISLVEYDESCADEVVRTLGLDLVSWILAAPWFLRLQKSVYCHHLSPLYILPHTESRVLHSLTRAIRTRFNHFA